MKKQNKILFPLLGGVTLLALTSLSAAQQGDPVHDQQLQRARKIYDVESWPIGARHAGYDLQRLSLPGHVGEAVEGSDGRVTRRFRDAESRELAFHVELEVHETAREAHEVLLGWIASVSADKLVPTGLQLDLAAGDRSYVGPSRVAEDRPLWFAFVRGNLAVRLTAHDPREGSAPALVDFARRIDDAFRAQEVLPAGVPLPRPKIEAFRCPQDECLEGTVLQLDLDVVDPAGRQFRPRFIIGGPGQGYVERGSDGRWRLFTTGPGEITLAVEVMGSTGTFTRSQQTLLVLDD